MIELSVKDRPRDRPLKAYRSTKKNIRAGLLFLNQPSADLLIIKKPLLIRRPILDPLIKRILSDLLNKYLVTNQLSLIQLLFGLSAFINQSIGFLLLVDII